MPEMTRPVVKHNPAALRGITGQLPTALQLGLRVAPNTHCEALESHLLDAENNV